MHPDTPDRVVPQLHETAAWLAAMDRDFMGTIMATDPQVLLTSTVLSADAAIREKLTTAILERFEKRGVAERDSNFSPRYDVLKHPKLADQLGPILAGKKHTFELRRVAMEIVESCQVTDLYDMLVVIALDNQEEWYIRHRAAFILSQQGGNTQRKAMLPLLNTTAEEDPEDELRGDALLALWPNHITARQAFEELSKERHGSLYGTFTIFIVSHLLKDLRLVDLPIALEWVAQHPAPSPFGGWHGLRSKIMRLGWDNWNEPKVLASFAKAATLRLKHYAGWFDDERRGSNIAEAPQEQRAAIVGAVIDYAAASDIKLPPFWGADVDIVRPIDLPWLLSAAARAHIGRVQREWARMVRTVFDWRSPGHVDEILTMMPEVPALRDEFEAHFAAVELGSDAAREMQESARRQAERAARDVKRQLRPVTERVTAELDKIDRGDVHGWWRVNIELLRRANDGLQSELVGDLTSFDSWREIGQGLQERCIAAAAAYVRAADPNNSAWFGTNTFYRPAAAGYRALHLLLSERPQQLDSLPAMVWEKWSAIVMAFPEAYGTQDIKQTQTLVSYAYDKAPSAIIKALLVLIDKENQDQGSMFILKKMEQCWDETLLNALSEKVQKDQSIGPQAFEELLLNIIEHDPTTSTRDFALAVVRTGENAVEDDLKPVKAAKVLLQVKPVESWPAIWEVLQKNSDSAVGFLQRSQTSNRSRMCQTFRGP